MNDRIETLCRLKYGETLGETDRYDVRVFLGDLRELHAAACSAQDLRRALELALAVWCPRGDPGGDGADGETYALCMKALRLPVSPLARRGLEERTEILAARYARERDERAASSELITKNAGTDPLGVTCPRCHAGPGVSCRGRQRYVARHGAEPLRPERSVVPLHAERRERATEAPSESPDVVALTDPHRATCPRCGAPPGFACWRYAPRGLGKNAPRSEKVKCEPHRGRIKVALGKPPFELTRPRAIQLVRLTEQQDALLQSAATLEGAEKPLGRPASAWMRIANRLVSLNLVYWCPRFHVDGSPRQGLRTTRLGERHLEGVSGSASTRVDTAP